MLTREEVIEIAKECGPYVDSTFEGDCRFAIAFAQACYRRGVEDAADAIDPKYYTQDYLKGVVAGCVEDIRKLLEE